VVDRLKCRVLLAGKGDLELVKVCISNLLVSFLLSLGGCLYVESAKLCVLEVFSDSCLSELFFIELSLLLLLVLRGEHVSELILVCCLAGDTLLEVVDAVRNAFSSLDLVSISLHLLNEWDLRPHESFFGLIFLLLVVLVLSNVFN